MSKITLTGFKAEYFITNKKLKFLRPIIEQWLKINREYIEYCNYSDSLYSYNERSTISTLAGAVWRCGGYAQEEYIAEKGTEKRNGRIDLFFHFSNKDVVIEAKQKFIWLAPNSRKNLHEHIKVSLDDSVKDAKQTKQANAMYYGDIYLAITFIVPYWHKDSNQNEKLKIIKQFSKSKDIDTDFSVIFESEEDIDHNDEGDVSNIVIMLCKVVN